MSVVCRCGWEGKAQTCRLDGEREEGAKFWGDNGGGGSPKEGGEEIFQDCVFNWGKLVGYIVDDSLDVLPLLLVGFLEGNKGALGG